MILLLLISLLTIYNSTADNTNHMESLCVFKTNNVLYTTKLILNINQTKIISLTCLKSTKNLQINIDIRARRLNLSLECIPKQTFEQDEFIKNPDFYDFIRLLRITYEQYGINYIFSIKNSINKQFTYHYDTDFYLLEMVCDKNDKILSIYRETKLYKSTRCIHLILIFLNY